MKKSRLFKIIICLLLILSLSFGSVSTVSANPVAIAMSADALLGSVLLACGVEYDSNFQDIVNGAMSSLDPETRDALLSVNQTTQFVINTSAHMAGNAVATFSKDQWAKITAWYDRTFVTATGTINATVPFKENVSGVPSKVMENYTNNPPLSTRPRMITMWNGNYYLYTFTDPVKIIWSKSMGCYTVDTLYNGCYWMYARSASNVFICDGAGTVRFDTLLAYTSIVMDGYSTTKAVSYSANDNYRPSAVPFPNLMGNGSVCVNVPVSPTYDVGSNSIDNPMSLGNVNEAVKSVDGYFDAGNTIKLADGTVVGSLPQAIRGTGTIADSGSVAGNVSGISSLVGSISGTLADIGTAIRDFFDIKDFNIDFKPLYALKGLSNVFPFCIPFDFANLIKMFSANPTDFRFSIDLETIYWKVHHVVDLSPFMLVILFFRYTVVAWFTFILISRTRDLIKW